VRFVVAHEPELQAEMLERAHEAREALFAGFAACAEGMGKWNRVRGEWLRLIERWNISPAQIPRLPIEPPDVALESARVDLARFHGIERGDGQLIPAPRSLVDGQPLARPVDDVEMRALENADLVQRAARGGS
jgi:hypothetical protein